MNETIRALLPQLANTTPAQLAQRLEQLGPRLEKDDWSALLYGIEAVGHDGDFDLAGQLMAACLRVARENKDTWITRAVRHFQGTFFYLQGQVERAMEAYGAVIAAGMAAGDEEGRIQASLALSDLAHARMAQGHIAEAIATMERALALSERLGRPADVAGNQLTLAGLYLVQEDFAAGEALLQKALVQVRQAGRPELLALTLMRQATVKEALNQPAKAIPYYESALAVLDAVEEPDDEEVFRMTYRDALEGLGMVYEELAQPEKAIEFYAEASRLAHEVGDKRNQAVVLTWLGTAQLAAGQPRLALRSFDAAERLARRSGHIWWLGTNSFFAASAWQALEKWDEAEAAVKRAMQYHAATPGEHNADEAGCLVKLGEIAVARDAFEVGVEYYQQALTELDQVEIGQMHRLIYLRLGEAHWYEGEFAQAYEMLRQALEVYESKRQTVSELWARVDFAPSRDLAYEYLARTCLELGRVVEALTVVEEGRMRVFREQLAGESIVDDLTDKFNWLDTRHLLS